MIIIIKGLPRWLSVSLPAGDTRDTSSITELERHPGVENINPQFSCLENSTDRGACSPWNQRVRHDRAQMHHNNKNNGKQVKETAPTWSQNWLSPETPTSPHVQEPGSS